MPACSSYIVISLGAEDIKADRKKWGCLPCRSGIWTQVWFCGHSQKTTKLPEKVGFFVLLEYWHTSWETCVDSPGCSRERSSKEPSVLHSVHSSSLGDQMGKQLKFCTLFSTLYSEEEGPSLGSRVTMLNYRGVVSLIVPIWNDRPPMAATFPWLVWVLGRRMCISLLGSLLANGSVWRFKWHIANIMVPISTSLWI